MYATFNPTQSATQACRSVQTSATEGFAYFEVSTPSLGSGIFGGPTFCHFRLHALPLTQGPEALIRPRPQSARDLQEVKAAEGAPLPTDTGVAFSCPLLDVKAVTLS